MFASFLTDGLAIDLVVCFFFQAEDGIRDLVRSRGLGDVYKRQGEEELRTKAERADRRLRVIYDNGTESDILMRSLQPVSYTHLTLPTSDLV